MQNKFYEPRHFFGTANDERRLLQMILHPSRRAAALLAALLLLFLGTAQAQAYSTLRYGSKGSEVKRMQEALAEKGYALKADGIYGKATRSAVRTFQQRNALKVDGIAGNQTLTALYDAASVTPPAPDTPIVSDTAQIKKALKKGGSAQEIKLMQAALTKALNKRVTADGVYGAKTTASVKTFQSNYGLKNDGIAGVLTLSVLYTAIGQKNEALMQGAMNLTGSALSLRAAAGENARSVISIPAGASVTLLYKDDAWYFCVYRDKTGFLPAASVTLSDRFSPLTNLSRLFDETIYPLTGDKKNDLLGIAFSQLGFRGGTRSAQRLNGTGAGGNYSKYGNYFKDKSEAYCSYFVSWCARKADISESVINNAKDVDGLFYDRQERFQYFFTPTLSQTQGQKLNPAHYAARGSVTPNAGDLIYLRWSSAPKTTTFSHIGIVYDADETWVYTIEGNSGGVVDTRMYRHTDPVISGYAHPNY